MQVLKVEYEVSLVKLLEQHGFDKSRLKSYVISVNGKPTTDLKQEISTVDRVVVLPKVAGG
jgi:molybdopterin converting factor small subunit